MVVDSNNSDEDKNRSYKWWVLVVVIIASFMAVLDSSIVNIALPHFMVAFGANREQVEWIITAYMIAFAILMPMATWLRNVLGLKTAFLLELSIFVIGSFLCSLAWSLDTLIIFRIIQAVGAGDLMPTGLTMISEVFPREERGLALGVWGAGITIAPAIGPILGGYLLDHVDWHSIFYINIPIGAIVFFWGIDILKKAKGNLDLFKHFDFIGFITFGLFLGSLLVALAKGQERGWSSNYILLLFFTSYISFFLFILTELAVKQPIIDLSIFKNYNFTMGNLLGIIRSLALFSTVFLLPLFFQNLMGYSATMTGVLLLPQALSLSVGMPIAGKLSDRIGPKIPMVIGVLLTTYSLYYFSFLSPISDSAFIITGLIIKGIGTSFIMAPLVSASINALKPEEINLGSGILNVTMQVGASFGITLLGLILVNRTDFNMATYVSHFVPTAPLTHVYLRSITDFVITKGSTFYNANIAGSASLIMYMRQWAVANAFDDAFLISAFVVFLGLIPALLFKNIKYGKKKTNKETIETTEL